MLNSKWTVITTREPDEEEKKEHPDWVYVLEHAPEDDVEVLFSDGKHVWIDELVNNGDFCYLDNSNREIEGLKWMYLPDPSDGQQSDNFSSCKEKVLSMLEELLREPQYQHEDEDWAVGVIMAMEIINSVHC